MIKAQVENTKTIKACFAGILTGDREESRRFARRARKVVYSAPCAEKRDKYRDIKEIVEKAPGEYAKIAEDWRQENFVMAVSVIYFLRDRKNKPDFLFPWFFKLLQHQRGYIRHAAVRMLCDDLGPLTVHIRCPDSKYHDEDDIKPEQADFILFKLFLNLNRILAVTAEPRFNRYKYVDSLPASPYKSVQMVLSEIEDLCGESYMRSLAKTWQRSLADREVETGPQSSEQDIIGKIR